MHKNLRRFDVSDYASEKRAALMEHRNALNDSDVKGLMEEGRVGDKLYESLGFVEIY